VALIYKLKGIPKHLNIHPKFIKNVLFDCNQQTHRSQYDQLMTSCGLFRDEQICFYSMRTLQPALCLRYCWKKLYVIVNRCSSSPAHKIQVIRKWGQQHLVTFEIIPMKVKDKIKVVYIFEPQFHQKR